MSPEEIQEVLAKHLAWRQGKPEGIRADLRNANLRNAYLRNANLRGADLRDANLRNANLRGAYLGGAYLGGAYLGGAYLRGAYLRGADLGGAYLGGAYLGGAYLRDADLRGADLRDANLRDAYLGGANLGGAYLPTGEYWEVYLSETIPALLTAGGKSLDDVVSHSWECHSWDNCPMAYAFDGHDIQDVPILLRPRAEQFVQLFDARLIPAPVISR